MESKWAEVPVMFRGAPVTVLEHASDPFVAYIVCRMYVHMPKSCGVITGIAAGDYPAAIRLPEGI